MTIAKQLRRVFHDPVAGLRQARRDTTHGLLAAGRTVAVAAGCAALVTGAVLMTHEPARDGAVTQLTRWMPVPTAAAAAFVQQIESRAEPTVNSAVGAAWFAVLSPSAEPEQENVTRYLSRRYRVAEGAVRAIVAQAYESGRQLRIDPALILGVMAIESSMNPFAQSSVGAQGLMQVMTRVHADKFEAHGGNEAALDPLANVRVGSLILADLVRRGGSVERGLQLYVGAGNMEDDGGYGARVLSEAARIRAAAGGKIDSALSSGLRADTRPAESRPATVQIEPAVVELVQPAEPKPETPSEEPSV
jgi:soluble lytic murein transglycosylase-like protein